jgi:DNA-binding transcriptional regulator YhcF (GntR family)
VPPARELAQTYGIANMTAHRALRELQNQGLIYGIPGKGSFVRPDARGKLAPEPVEIRNEQEYQAVLAEFQASTDAAFAELDAAIATEDIETIKAAKERAERSLIDHHGAMLGMSYYSHRKAGRNVDGPAPTAAERKARRAQPDTTAD